MILKRHLAPFFIPQKKPLIWQYDTEKNISRQVDIKDVCKEKYLYELKSNNKIVENNVNYLENQFGYFEKKWDQILNKVENKESLNERDIIYLYILIAFQTLRTPEVLNFSVKFIKNEANSLSLEQSNNLARLTSFLTTAFMGVDGEGIIEGVMGMLLTKEMTIYHSQKPFIINSNRPVLYSILNKHKLEEYYRVNFYFPFASNYCIALLNKVDEFYCEIPDEMVDFLNIEIYNLEGRYIYSSQPIHKIIKEPDTSKR